MEKSNILDVDKVNILASVGVSCFSAVRDDILMWSHYAAQHTGVCIGFDTRRHIFQTAWEVSYQDDLPTIYRPQDDEETMLQKSLMTKSSHWRYEREWRIVRRTMTDSERLVMHQKYGKLSAEAAYVLLHQVGPGFYSFPKEAITEISLGVKMPPAKRKMVIEWVQAAGLKVPIYHADLARFKYQLEFKKI